MDARMRWEKLLSGIRLRDGKVKDRTLVNEYDLRNDFDDDYGRVIFSAAVRRLQDKAQVFPLDNSDFVRTRLTHSLEVSTIGRSIGVSVEEKLIENKKLSKEHKGKISALLAIIGIVHDLGNPPYGHFGEVAIQKFFANWFINNKEGKRVRQALSDAQAADFEYFEGNAQTFRLLTKLNNLKDEFGYNISAASLASVLKYPRSSVQGNKDKEARKKEKLGVSYKKFGYLQSEKERFIQVQEYTGIGDFRHPIAFLLEAADDIAYSAADIEDGCKKKVLDYHTIERILKNHLSKGTEEEIKLFDSFVKTYKNGEGRPDRLDNVVQNFRIEAQGYMIKSVVKEFLKRYDEILDGKFDQEIIKTSEAANVRGAFEELANIIFKSREILKREYAGGKVVEGLLQMFLGAVISNNYRDSKTSEGKLFFLISDNYRDIMDRYPCKVDNDDPSLYDKLLLVTDFICGMTDTYALELYKSLTGINL